MQVLTWGEFSAKLSAALASKLLCQIRKRFGAAKMRRTSISVPSLARMGYMSRCTII